VQENDTAASIASNFGISVEELRQANDLPENNLIFVGQTLFIPGQQEENPIVGRRFEGQRGTLVITTYGQSDGSSREEFTFVMKNEGGSFSYALLEDVTFEAMLPYHHRPINVWGTVNRVNENGTPIISVERYEAPFPGLRFQLVQGTQQMIEIDGLPATLFTRDDSKSYVQASPNGSLDNSIIGNIGDQVYAEALMIPDEIVGGYPVMRVFSMGMAVNPKNGEPATIEITADQPFVLEEGLSPENYILPTATIEKVEVVYYIPDPRYGLPESGTDPQYIQPAWRFYGHYSNGDELELLVQALKQEYLLPELAPYRPPG
jgi:LysM repeat protein